MNALSTVLAGTALAAVLAGSGAFADDRRVDFDFNLGVGASYDTNVALIELDSNAGEPDAVALLEAGLGARVRLGENFRLATSYDFSATRYREFSDFDLDLHHGHLSLTRSKGLFDGAIAIDYFEGVLSGEDYLTQTQLSPSVSRLFGSRWFLRGAYARGDKAFATQQERNARSDALRFDTYLLLDGMDHYVALSAQALAEDARSADYDFGSVMGQLSWGYRIDNPRNDVNLKASLRFERREFDSVMLESGRMRSDDRLRARVAATIPLSEHATVAASIERTQNTSGLPSANLDRSVYTVEYGVAF